MYVCMYVCMHVCMHAHENLSMHGIRGTKTLFEFPAQRILGAKKGPVLILNQDKVRVIVIHRSESL